MPVLREDWCREDKIEQKMTQTKVQRAKTGTFYKNCSMQQYTYTLLNDLKNNLRQMH